VAALATARRLATGNDIVVCTDGQLEGIRRALREESSV
jgi:hypothetical protein